MNGDERQRERLLRLLEGRLPAADRAQVEEWLRADPGARAFLREVAEQSVMIADLGRTDLERAKALRADSPPRVPSRRVPALTLLGSWRGVLALATPLLLVAVLVPLVWPGPGSGKVRITRVTGANHFFGSSGTVENDVGKGMALGAGDTLETLSCDAWIEMGMPDGSTITLAGHSVLRILHEAGQGERFRLLQGSLWAEPDPGAATKPVRVETPTVTVDGVGAQFDVQTSSAETMVRVNAGSAQVTRLRDGRSGEVPAGYQVAVSLSRQDALAVVAQPKPVDRWACALSEVPKVLLGQWQPPREGEPARLRAEPLPWPVPGREPVMLFAVAISAWNTSEQPVLLHSDSRLRISGRTERAQSVRFGVSTQRMRGVFAGKFETDVPPEALGPVGEPWTIELSLGRFRPLHPQLPRSPEGLELNDIYALTIHEDAGLEIERVELIPGPGAVD